MNKRTILVCAVLVLTLIGSLLVAFFPQDDVLAPEQVVVHRSKANKPKPRLKKSVKPTPKVAPQPLSIVSDKDMSPEDVRLSQNIQNAIDKNDFESIRELANEAIASTNAEVRQNYVEAAGWFGAKAIDLLAKFLVDKNKDVRESAGNYWQVALSDIVDESTKAGLVQVALQNVDDEDLVDMLASEYYGMDEKLAVESIVQVVTTGGKENGVRAAQEAYQFVTGDEWTSPDDAWLWLQENYTPPESD